MRKYANEYSRGYLFFPPHPVHEPSRRGVNNSATLSDPRPTQPDRARGRCSPTGGLDGVTVWLTVKSAVSHGWSIRSQGAPRLRLGGSGVIKGAAINRAATERMMVTSSASRCKSWQVLRSSRQPPPQQKPRSALIPHNDVLSANLIHHAGAESDPKNRALYVHRPILVR